MQKKFVSIILSVSLVLLSVAPCFAIENSTGAAIKSLKLTNDTKATSPSTTVEPEDSSATRYYVNSNGSVSSSSTSINTWGNIVNDLTYSIAYSIGEVVKRLTTINNNVINYLFSNASTGYYLWDWTSTGGVYQGAPTSSQSVITQLRAMGSSITKMLSYSTEYTYQLYDNIVNGTGMNVNVANTNFEKWLDVGWGRFDQYYYTPNNFTQTYRTWDIRNSTSYLYNILDAIVRNGNTTSALVALTNYRGYISYLDDDLVQQQGNWFNSFPQAIAEYGYLIQSDLKRIRYVIASDEEIEARQAAADNQESVVDNFIKPTGTGSASASDFADVASAGSSIKDALDSNVSAGNAFTSLDSNSDAWNWFSQSTLNSLDSSSSQNRKSANSNTPFLDSYYSDLMETLRLK